MTLEIGLVLGIVGIAIALFSFEKISPDVIALGIILLLVLSGLLPLERALSGLGSEAFMLVLGLLVMTAALEKTGVVDMMGNWVNRMAGKDGKKSIWAIVLAAAGLSALMSNTGSTAFFLPIAIGMARSEKITRSKLLMPLAFSSILASSVTLIATTTNIVVSGLMEDEGMPPLGMFELAPVGMVILAVGIIYLMTIGEKLTPDRPYEEPFSAEASVRNYLTELIVPQGSKLCGKTISQAALGRDLDLTVLRISKNNRNFLAPTAGTLLEAGDLLIVEGDRDELLEIEGATGLELKPRSAIENQEFQSKSISMFEVILLPRSPLIGRTLKQLDFRRKYGLQVLGINRSGRTIRRKLSEVRLGVGDQLLLHGNRVNAVALDRSNAFRLLHVIRADDRDPRKAILTIGVFFAVLALAALHLFSVAVAALLGMLLMFLMGSITPEEAYQRVNWRVLILISGMLALGIAIQESGTAVFLSDWIIQKTSGMDPRWLLGAFFLLSMLLSQPMSNQAAAVVVVPIAIQTALGLGLNPRSFAVMIAVGASCSFLTPLEPSCMMVYGPGNYRFMDFIKVGLPLTLIIFIIAETMVPVLWPL
ncbi:MAG: SLC13 family permease [Anaerolineaceae bacterium]|nr:SLC13 family permease [Anaerolineaceae bacterium]